MTVAFLEQCKTYARSKTWIKDLDPLISPSIGYISARGNVGYIFCISQLQFNACQNKGNTGSLFKFSIMVVHVAVNIGCYEI